MPESAELPRIALYADLACPYAYITAYRLRQLRDAYRGRAVIEHKCLSLEYVNHQPTPKPTLESEIPILMLQQPDLPWQPWHAPLWQWPVTIWPAFEAVKCAEWQSYALADDLAWAIRTAFFVESRCISMRYVLLELAAQVGLDVSRFTADFDSGKAKPQVIAESREGWERLKVAGSPTFVLPSGRQLSNLGLPEVEVDERQHGRVTGLRPAPCTGDECLALYQQMVEDAITQTRRT